MKTKQMKQNLLCVFNDGKQKHKLTTDVYFDHCRAAFLLKVHIVPRTGFYAQTLRTRRPLRASGDNKDWGEGGGGCITIKHLLKWALIYSKYGPPAPVKLESNFKN